MFSRKNTGKQIQSNLVIRNVLIRNKLVLRNHFLWPIVNLLHKDKEYLALRVNSRVTKKSLITKFDCSRYYVNCQKLSTQEGQVVIMGLKLVHVVDEWPLGLSTFPGFFMHHFQLPLNLGESLLCQPRANGHKMPLLLNGVKVFMELNLHFCRTTISQSLPKISIFRVWLVSPTHFPCQISHLTSGPS